MTEFPRKDRRYLSGMDWLVHGFDYLAKKATGAGNLSQIVWELSNRLNVTEFERAMRRFVSAFPVFKGRVARAWNLAPYWKMNDDQTPPRIDVLRSSHPDIEHRDQLVPLIADCANRGLNDRQSYLEFRLFSGKSRDTLVMTFDHRVLDARGAEMFMWHFQDQWRTGGGGSKTVFSAPSHLKRWIAKFRSGQVVNRTLLKMARNGRIRVIGVPQQRPLRGFRFRVFFFDADQTREIVDHAYDRAGYLLLMPFLLAAGLRAMKPVFDRRGRGSGDLVMPVSVDLREPAAPIQDVFFNHLSFLMFHVDQRTPTDVDAWIETIKDQYFAQVKSGFPRHLGEVSHLMRIAPQPLLSRIMRTYLRGQLASFCFSHVTTPEAQISQIAESPILRQFHLPRLPIPPGLGLFFHQAQEQMNICLSWIDGMLEDEDVAEIVDRLQSVLLRS